MTAFTKSNTNEGRTAQIGTSLRKQIFNIGIIEKVLFIKHFNNVLQTWHVFINRLKRETLMDTHDQVDYHINQFHGNYSVPYSNYTKLRNVHKIAHRLASVL